MKKYYIIFLYHKYSVFKYIFFRIKSNQKKTKKYFKILELLWFWTSLIESMRVKEGKEEKGGRGRKRERIKRRFIEI